MAKNTSIESRFSLNSTHLPQPIAESTCLNLNGCSWVNAPLSPQYHSNSNGCLAQTPKSAIRHATENVGRIDARTYTDVQSNGLTSRIVQYHNNKIGTRLNRSTSMSALYSRPGQFPVVHLKKTEIPISASKRNQLSMTRIAPPEKSLFYGNTLSGLLRSNSIVCSGNQKNDRKFSHENRPIIHPPPTEDDTMPTRSVLDVLKEISRKRINSEDDDGRMEASMKKYCNRESQEQLDSTAIIVSPQQYFQRRQFSKQKRPREQKSLANTPNSNNRTPPAQINVSPEQTAKSRRLSNFNNDITSSLSSSQIYVNKRKLYDSPQGKKSLSDEHEISMQRFKMQRQKLTTDIAARTMSCDAVASNYSFLTPIPSTSQVNVENSNNNKSTRNDLDGVPSMRTMSTPLCVYKDINTTSIKSKPRVTLFNKNYEVEEKTINHNNNNNNKEDLSLSSEINNTDDGVEGDNDDNSYAEIQFVKPKKGELLSGSKHPLIQRTQKSKLALMLCGLRGELYQGDEVSSNSFDELDTYKTTSVTTTKANMIEQQDKSNHLAGISTTNQNTEIMEKEKKEQQQQEQPAHSNTMTSSKLTDFQITPTTLEKTPVAATVVQPIKKTTSPLVGIKLTPAKPMDNTANITSVSNEASAITTTTNSTVPNSLDNINFQFGVPAKTSMPTLKMGSGSFNFSSNNNNNANNNNNNTIEKNEAAETNVGLTPQAATFAGFGMPNTTTATTTNTLQSATPAFTFNMPSTNAASITTTTMTFSISQATSTNTTAGAGSFFAFGSEKLPTNTTTNTASTAAPFAFGVSVGNESTAQAVVNATTTTTNGGFSFANSIANAAKPTASAAPFSLNNSAAKSADNNNNNNGATLGGFTFSNINNNNNSNTNNNNGFTFGSNSNTGISSTVFGTSGNITNATPALGFHAHNGDTQIPSSTTTTTSSTMPTFNLFNSQTTNPATMTNFALVGDAKNTTKPAFSFGNTTAATTTNNNNNNNTNNNINSSHNSIPIATTTANLFGAAASMNNNNNNNNNNGNTQGVLKSNFTFGNNNNNNNTTNNTNDNKTTMGNSNFSFGNLVNNSASSKTFTFGSTINTNENNNNNSVQNIFGTASNTSTPTPTPTFGSVGQSGNVSTVAPFGFDQKPMDNANKPFAFGSGGSVMNQNNLFGGASAAPPSAGTMPMFNFQNTTTNQAAGSSPIPSMPTMNNNNNNMFSPSPGNDRPIRRATRRLNKP